MQSSPGLIVLDTQKNPYKFTVPAVSSNIDMPPSLGTHLANLFGNYMIIAFGNNYLTYIHNISCYLIIITDCLNKYVYLNYNRKYYSTKC